MKKKVSLLLLALTVLITSCSDDNEKTSSTTSYPTSIQNSYPIVLVHGMCGWGRDEMKGFLYWGGNKGDIQEDLKSQGHEVYTASVGPLSSNWDRAVELYYYIKGGTVDYGAIHAEKYGHARYGKTYPGAYPQWDGTNKVHLIGHSMGGPTPRYLIQLLENGDPQEIAFRPSSGENPTSDLFKGGKNWVHSHTTVAGVHNGALTADYFEFRETIEKMFFSVTALGGITQEGDKIYDFDLGQWGIQKQDGETLVSYFNRIKGSKFWNTEDNCMYDLSVKASDYQNTYATTSNNIYYASYAIDGTEDDNKDGVFMPLNSMSPIIKADAIEIGKTTKDLPFGYMAWRPNDGLVSIPSAQYPIGHKFTMMDPLNRVLAPKGTWDVHPTIMGPDHLSIVIPDDAATTIDYLYTFYRQVANDLARLPQ